MPKVSYQSEGMVETEEDDDDDSEEAAMLEQAIEGDEEGCVFGEDVGGGDGADVGIAVVGTCVIGAVVGLTVVGARVGETVHT